MQPPIVYMNVRRSFVPSEALALARQFWDGSMFVSEALGVPSETEFDTLRGPHGCHGLHYAQYELPGSWEGRARLHFDAEFGQIIRRLHSLAARLEDQAREIENTRVEVWERVPVSPQYVERHPEQEYSER